MKILKIAIEFGDDEPTKVETKPGSALVVDPDESSNGPPKIKHPGWPKVIPRKPQAKIGSVNQDAGIPGVPKSRSPRADEVLHYISQGLANKQIAEKMGIGEDTVKNYVMDLCREFNVQSRVELIIHALKSGDLKIEEL